MTCRLFCISGLLLLGLLTGCTPHPPPVLQTLAVAPHLVAQRYQTDQQQRQQLLRQWQSLGILEIRSEKANRRLRAELQGTGTEKAKVTLFGFMQNIAGVIAVTAEQIELVDADKQQITVVPATAEGLHYLLGIALPPEDLLHSLLAMAAPLQGVDPDVAGGWLTKQGESLLLDPRSGLVRERQGETREGRYRVVYQWSTEEESSVPPLPQQIAIDLQPADTHIQFRSRQWQIIAQPFAADTFTLRARYPDFTVEHPWQER
ncbi:lipoprotein insertase outer membrane protein LolB [Candidatus Magnetaquicoccus inordinatus]|uniref:lipoprotein insertase outer membrane protein LolB n=1 Tax=Candidatus Magnetaquicoccus inordinatus TaxID=2496818 RepID=UPI00187D55BD|nr:lipoprotein insertase outer membrane protein LolB [Candidatus Magnetaquicoccus inordinatus]